MTLIEEPAQTAPTATPPADTRRARIRRTLRGYGDLRRTPFGLAPIGMLSAIFLFQRFDSELFSVGIPEITKATGVSLATLIQVLQFIGFFAVFGALYVGFYSDRHRRVPIVAIGTIVSGIAAIVSGFGTTGLRFGFPRVIDDVSNAASDVPTFGLVADYYPPEARGRVFALFGTVSRVAKLISLPLAGVLIGTLGVRTSFLIAGIPIIISGLVALVRLREPVRGYFERLAFGTDDESARVEDEPRSFGEAWRSTFAVRTLRRLFAADLINSMADPSGLFTLLLLSENYGLTVQARALVLTLPVVSALVGGYIAGTQIDRFSVSNPQRVLTIVGLFRLVGAAGLLITGLQPPLVILTASLCIASFGGALLGPANNAVYSQVVPAAIRTQALQVSNMSSIPAFLFGYTIAYSFLHNYGYTAAFMFMVPFQVVAALVAASAGKFFDIDRRNAIAESAAGEEWKRARDSGNAKLLVCRKVEVQYNGVQVLFGVDFDVEEGQIIALLGTNGAGKSTLLRAISGSQEASGGAVVFDGRDITHMPPHETAARGVIHMPGGRGVFPGMSVRENLLLGNWLTEDQSVVRQKLDEVFEIFPILAERADELAGSLSGGEQQQLSLAQAFLANPKLLMIDELSLGLSPAVVGELLDIVRRIHERGVTIIVVEQSVNVALSLADRAIFMEKGEVRFFGETAELLRRPDILRAVYVKGTGALTDGAPAAARQGERNRRALEMDQARPILEVEGIVRRFGGIVALNGVSLALRDGEVLGLIGPNGSGKTTLFDVISGFQAPDEGVIRFEGVDITSTTPEERARRKLVRRFQDAKLFPSLTVFETLMIALDQRLESKSAILGAASMPQVRRAERRLRARAEALIDLLDLGAYRDKFVKELSTGLRRIVDVACVLGTEPRVLLLDEPSSGIAQAEAEGLGPLLRRVRFETGCSILIIEHDMPLISTVSDELVVLDRGTVLTRGNPTDVLNDERVIEAYLGGSEEAVKRSGSLV